MKNHAIKVSGLVKGTAIFVDLIHLPFLEGVTEKEIQELLEEVNNQMRAGAKDAQLSVAGLAVNMDLSAFAAMRFEHLES